MAVTKGLPILAAALLATALSTPAEADPFRDYRGYNGGYVVERYGYVHGYRPYLYDRYRSRAYRVRPYNPYAAPPRAPVNRHVIEGRMDVQRRLNQLGFQAGPVDGVYGSQTRDAMAAFQASIGAAPTGRLTGNEVAILNERARAVTTASTAPVVPLVPEAPAEEDIPVIPVPDIDLDDDSLSVTTEDSESLTDTAALGEIDTDPDVGSATRPRTPATTGSIRQIVAQRTSRTPSATIDDGSVRTLPEGALPIPIPRMEPGAGPFGDRAWLPKIFGVTTGDEREAVKRALTENGYRECLETGETMVCSQENRSMTDSISVAFSKDRPGKPAYLLRRSLSFKKPVERSFLERQMVGRYPDLLEETNGVKSSSDVCAPLVGLAPGKPDGDKLQAFFDNRRTDAAIDDATLDLIDACPDLYALAFDGEETVNALDIVLFDASAMRTRLFSDLQERRSSRSEENQPQGGTIRF